MRLVRPVNKPVLRRAKIFQIQEIRLDKNYKSQNVSYKKYNIHQYEKKDKDKFNKVDAKL